MAIKRMFDIEIINQDIFIDLPMEAKALYFLLGMEADDEGFVSPKKVLRLYGGNADSINILILKKFIIPFESGVVVITDWKRNNYLDKSRTKETIYQNEKNLINFNEQNEKYELNECLTDVKQMLNNTEEQQKKISSESVDISMLNKCLTNVEQMLNQNSIEENSIVEHSIDKSSSSIEKSDSCDDGLQEIINFYNQNIGILTPYGLELLQDYLKDIDYEVIIYAMKLAIQADVRTINYIKAVLNNWCKKNIKTLVDAQKENQLFRNKSDNQQKLEDKEEKRKKDLEMYQRLEEEMKNGN